ncbi:MAG: hypothetical protein AB2A00_25055 [Myxococcota bacterium]
MIVRDAALLALLLLAGCPQQPGRERATASLPTEMPEARIRVKSNSGDGQVAVVDPFVTIETTWSNVNPGDEQYTEVFTPAGRCFLKSTVAIGRGGVTQVHLPIQGTSIDTYLMTGIWKAVVYRNSAPTPSAKEFFEVTSLAPGETSEELPSSSSSGSSAPGTTSGTLGTDAGPGTSSVASSSSGG